MPDLPSFVIAGPSGRMGQTLIECILQRNDCQIIAALAPADGPWTGRDLGQVMGRDALNITVEHDPVRALNGADAILDFTTPDASVALARAAADQGVAHIIGTTGFTAEQIASLDLPGAVQVRAGNMSLGVNLLAQLTRRAARALGEDYDIEIIEAHHRHKVDAPSGTALMLGEAAAEGRGTQLSRVREAGRDGITGARKPGTIGFSAIRGGDIIGEHDVMLAGPGEMLVLSHRASDRNIYANGAIKAALWASGRNPGQYDMMDVLGISD